MSGRECGECESRGMVLLDSGMPLTWDPTRDEPRAFVKICPSCFNGGTGSQEQARDAGERNLVALEGNPGGSYNDGISR